MIIQHEEINHKGSFFVKQEDALLAEMTYSIKDDQIMTIHHTEVDEQLKGQKIGYQLVQHGVDFARRNHYK
ncbi:MAG TPA: GNAT family N-acetyltransferase, partial [Ferruginibacter sp.]|nr:GNAT family N-acetyltransferase [Ferruginibacter sp.]